jgi:hypothetical protein
MPPLVTGQLHTVEVAIVATFSAVMHMQHITASSLLKSVGGFEKKLSIWPNGCTTAEHF